MLLCEAHWIFNRLYLGIRVPRGLALEGLTLRTPEGRLARDRSEPAADGEVEGEAKDEGRLSQIGRLFSKQHVVLFFAAEFPDIRGDLGPAGYGVTARLDGVACEARVD